MSDVTAFSLDQASSHPHPDPVFPQASFHTHATMSSNPASPTRPSPSDLQSHLYTSFLQRKTADVALRISGSWNAIYRLHRVILIQAVRRTFCAFWLSLLIPFELHRASFSRCLLRASASPHLSCTVITEIRIVSILFSMTLISRELVSKASILLPACTSSVVSVSFIWLRLPFGVEGHLILYPVHPRALEYLY